MAGSLGVWLSVTPAMGKHQMTGTFRCVSCLDFAKVALGVLNRCHGTVGGFPSRRVAGGVPTFRALGGVQLSATARKPNTVLLI